MGTGSSQLTGAWLSPPQVQEANAHLAEQAGPHEVEITPVQRRIEPRSADDSLSGVVRCLYFADTFLRDGEQGWAARRERLAVPSPPPPPASLSSVQLPGALGLSKHEEGCGGPSLTSPASNVLFLDRLV